MQEIVFAAVIDGIVALKGASGGLPNALLRDLNAIHPNTGFSDLPRELQGAIAASVRDAFGRLRREGYVVAHAEAAAPMRAPARPRPTGPRPTGPKPGGTKPGGTKPGGTGKPPRGRRPPPSNRGG